MLNFYCAAHILYMQNVIKTGPIHMQHVNNMLAKMCVHVSRIFFMLRTSGAQSTAKKKGIRSVHSVWASCFSVRFWSECIEIM